LHLTSEAEQVWAKGGAGNKGSTSGPHNLDEVDERLPERCLELIPFGMTLIPKLCGSLD
jgi:hypothetical protein